MNPTPMMKVERHTTSEIRCESLLIDAQPLDRIEDDPYEAATPARRSPTGASPSAVKRPTFRAPRCA